MLPISTVAVQTQYACSFHAEDRLHACHLGVDAGRRLFQAATVPVELCGGAASGLNETDVGTRELQVPSTAADDSEGLWGHLLENA